MLLIPLVFVLVYYCYLSQLYATLCGYVNRPLGPLYIVIPCVNIIKYAKPIGFTVYQCLWLDEIGVTLVLLDFFQQ